jgi:RNA polymerase sigma factor (sigma-70 family)
MHAKDPDLIQACLNGDESAWKELVERYARLVYSIPYRWGFSSADADDVFQNVFTIVYRRLESLRDQNVLAAWLIRITKHECQRLRRRSPNEIEPPESLTDSAASLDDDVEILERQHLIRAALKQLEPRCRELLTALFLESATPNYAELSARLDIPIGSIGPTRARCFKKLEDRLVEMGFDAVG